MKSFKFIGLICLSLTLYGCLNDPEAEETSGQTDTTQETPEENTIEERLIEEEIEWDHDCDAIDGDLSICQDTIPVIDSMVIDTIELDDDPCIKLFGTREGCTIQWEDDSTQVDSVIEIFPLDSLFFNPICSDPATGLISHNCDHLE